MHRARRLGLCLGLSLALFAATEARATFVPTATATISIDDLNQDVPITTSGTQFLLNGGSPYTLVSDDRQETATVSGTADSDPMISYTLSVVNSDTVTHTFTFTESVPIVSTPAGTLVTSTISGTFNGPLNGGPATLSPVGENAGVQEGSINGVSIPDLFVGVIQIGTGMMAYPTGGGVFSASSTSVSTINALDITTSFTLTAGATATLNGSIVTVPEPASMTLTGLGVLVLGYAARRRTAV